MKDLELNKALHEKVMGKCWHEWEEGICKKCQLDWAHSSYVDTHLPSYTTNPADYWELLQKAKEHEKFVKFIDHIGENEEFIFQSPYTMVKSILLDMPRGCQAIYDFFCKES